MMTIELDVNQPHTSLQSVLEAIRGGNEVVLAENGRLLAKVMAVEPLAIDRSNIRGMLKGKIWMADDFDELPAEELELWYRDDPLLRPKEGK